jgi:hypothetical protein
VAESRRVASRKLTQASAPKADDCPDANCCVVEVRYTRKRLNSLDRKGKYVKIPLGASRTFKLAYSSAFKDGINVYSYITRGTVQVANDPNVDFDTFFLPLANVENKVTTIVADVVVVNDEVKGFKAPIPAFNLKTVTSDEDAGKNASAKLNPCGTPFGNTTRPKVGGSAQDDVCIRQVLQAAPVYVALRIWKDNPALTTITTMGSMYTIMFGLFSIIVGLAREKIEHLAPAEDKIHELLKADAKANPVEITKTIENPSIDQLNYQINIHR